jgi:DNA-directed RNA polymerase subunit beta'
LSYIVQQVQNVYVSQGVDINDKHIEVIARQMLRRVSVQDPGDSDYLPGDRIDAYQFASTAEEIVKNGGKAPTGKPLLLGISKAAGAVDSWLSAASFQETPSHLTDASIDGRMDHLVGLKENVILGKLIPAGTGLGLYRDHVDITYNGEVLDRGVKAKATQLPEWAPKELQELEEMLPQPEEWMFDDENFQMIPPELAQYFASLGYGKKKPPIPIEQAKLYLFDDLGVSQRWSNKFAEAGIEMVGDLIGKTEDDLLEIEGIGAKAIEELRAGLAERDLERILDEDFAAGDDDVSDIVDMVFSPDNPDLYLGGEVPQTYSADPDDIADDDGLSAILPDDFAEVDTTADASAMPEDA